MIISSLNLKSRYLSHLKMSKKTRFLLPFVLLVITNSVVIVSDAAQLLTLTSNGLSSNSEQNVKVQNNSVSIPSLQEFGNESFSNSRDSSEEDETISSSSTTTERVPTPYPFPHRYPQSAGQLTIVIALSFIVPATFMFLLFWRLQKEKKYLNAQAGALIYRETIIVPSYNYGDSINSQNGNAESNNGPNNAAYMHAMLYDTPPAYDVAVKTTSEVDEKKPDLNEHEVPPPPYTTIHL